MKHCTILYTIAISTVMIFSPAWGMDLGQSTLGLPSDQPRFDLSRLEQSSIHSTSQFSEKKKLFLDASYALTESLLPSLLKHEQLLDPQKKIDSTLKNISIMKDFIQTQGHSKTNRRILELTQIENTLKTQPEIPPKTIKDWINVVESIAEITLNPNEMMESTIQLDEVLEQKARKEEEQQKKTFQDINDLVTKSPELLNFMNEKNWDQQTKIYVLQLLFWYAHQQKNSSYLQVAIIKTLRDLNANAPHIVHQRGSIPYPIFSYSLEKLPEDAPQSLKNLFEQIKADLLENQLKNPRLAIETYHQDIEDQKKLLASESEMEKLIQTAKKFRDKYGSISKSPKKAEFTEELVEMRTKTEATKEELNKLAEQNRKFAAKRAQENIGGEKIRTNIETSISTKQKEMEALIKKQVEQLSSRIAHGTDISALDTVIEELKLYKTYVSDQNEELRSFIDISIQNLTALSTTSISQLSPEEQRKQVDAALQIKIKEELHLMKEEKIEKAIDKIKEDQGPGFLANLSPVWIQKLVDKNATLQIHRDEAIAQLQKRVTAEKIRLSLDGINKELTTLEIPQAGKHFPENFFTGLSSNIKKLEKLQEEYPENEDIVNSRNMWQQTLETNAKTCIQMIAASKDPVYVQEQTIDNYFPEKDIRLKSYRDQAIEPIKAKSKEVRDEIIKDLNKNPISFYRVQSEAVKYNLTEDDYKEVFKLANDKQKYMQTRFKNRIESIQKNVVKLSKEQPEKQPGEQVKNWQNPEFLKKYKQLEEAISALYQIPLSASLYSDEMRNIFAQHATNTIDNIITISKLIDHRDKLFTKTETFDSDAIKNLVNHPFLTKEPSFYSLIRQAPYQQPSAFKDRFKGKWDVFAQACQTINKVIPEFPVPAADLLSPTAAVMTIPPTPAPVTEVPATPVATVTQTSVEPVATPVVTIVPAIAPAPQQQPQQPTVVIPVPPTASAQPEAPDQTPTFWSNIRTGLTNMWQGITSFFGNITSTIASWFGWGTGS